VDYDEAAPRSNTSTPAPADDTLTPAAQPLWMQSAQEGGDDKVIIDREQEKGAGDD
jgi:hypothetical protein